MGWLNDLTNWFKDAITAIWKAVVDFFHDLIVLALDGVMSLISMMINAIPTPDFLSAYSLGAVLGDAGPVVGWALGTLKIGQGLSIIAAAYAFRMMRKVMTAFQW